GLAGLRRHRRQGARGGLADAGLLARGIFRNGGQRPEKELVEFDPSWLFRIAAGIGHDGLQHPRDGRISRLLTPCQQPRKAPQLWQVRCNALSQRRHGPLLGTRSRGSTAPYGPQTTARWPKLFNSVLERCVPLRNM